MYTTVFDLVDSSLTLPGPFKIWRGLQPGNKALIVGALVIVMTLGLGAIACYSSFTYSPFVLLGLFYGAFLAKLLATTLAPKVQTLTTGFLTGIVTGSLGAQQNAVLKAVEDLGKKVSELPAIINLPGSVHSDLTNPLKWCFWLTIATTGTILAANLYFAGKDTNTVGDPKNQHALPRK